MSTHRSADAVYHFTDYVYYALAVSRKLGWKKFSILGHSLGALGAGFVLGVLTCWLAWCAYIHTRLTPHDLINSINNQHNAYIGAAIGIALAGTYPESVLRVVTVEALGLISKPAEAAPATLRYVRQQGRFESQQCMVNPHTFLPSHYQHHPNPPRPQRIDPAARGVGGAAEPHQAGHQPRGVGQDLPLDGRGGGGAAADGGQVAGQPDARGDLGAHPGGSM